MSDTVVIVVFVATLLPFVACVWAYGWRAFRSELGRVLQGLLLSICAVLSLGIITRLLDFEGTAANVLRVVTLALVTIAGWLLFRQIVRIQRRPSADCLCSDRIDH